MKLPKVTYHCEKGYGIFWLPTIHTWKLNWESTLDYGFAIQFLVYSIGFVYHSRTL